MRKVLFFLFFQGLFFSLFSQNITYARKVVDTLTSEYFSGRGAVNGGEKKAANYIANQFSKHGLKQFNDSFFQEFNYSINTFPREVSVSLDNTILEPGVDYIVGAASGKINGTYELMWFDKERCSNQAQLNKLKTEGVFTNKFIVIDHADFDKENELFQALKENSLGAAGLIFIEKKLTQHIAATYNDFGVLHVKREFLKKGYKTISLTIDQELISDYQSQNVIGYVEGTEYPDSFIVLSAHYDHLGKMGDEVYFPGANDNASGVAMLLNLVDHYTHKEPPTKTIIFIAFGAEESGLVGSKYFVENPVVPLGKINFVFNMDLMGTGNEGAMVVNGRIFKNYYNKLVDINNENNYLSNLKKRGKAKNSDHYWFSEKGVPAFFMYLMGGISAYHDVYDVSKTLPLTKFEDSFRLIRDFVDEL